jgi:hypothetical protein
MEIQFQGQLTEKDFKKIRRYFSRRLLLLWSLIFLVMYLSNIDRLIYTIKNNPSGFIHHLLPGVVVITLLYFMLQYMTKLEWRKNLIRQEPFIGKITDTGIEWTIENISTTKLSWNYFTKYRDRKDIIQVLYGFNDSYIFMKDYFANEKDWQELKEILAQNVSK